MVHFQLFHVIKKISILKKKQMKTVDLLLRALMGQQKRKVKVTTQTCGHLTQWACTLGDRHPATAEVPGAELPDALAPVLHPKSHLKLPLENQSSTWGSEDIPDVVPWGMGCRDPLVLRAKPTTSCNRQTSMEGMILMAWKSQRRFQSLQRTQPIQLERLQRQPEEPQATRCQGWSSRSRHITATRFQLHGSPVCGEVDSNEWSMRNSSFSSWFSSSLAPFWVFPSSKHKDKC